MMHQGLFEREVFVESCCTPLTIQQQYIGDVGCVVWDAGIALSKYLDWHAAKQGNSGDPSSNAQGKRVLELGSGTGIVGLVAACLGARVTLTDLPECIPILELNLICNKDVLKGEALVKVLKWGQDVSGFEHPDLILVADCIYYEESLEPLVLTLSELSGPHTVILMSYEIREGERALWLRTRFFELLKGMFDYQIVDRKDQHPEYQSNDIHIVKIWKRLSSS